MKINLYISPPLLYLPLAVLIITWELNVVSFFKIFFYFAILLREFIGWLSILKQNRLQSITVSLRSKILSQHHGSINTSHPFHPHHSSWPWLLAQINSYLRIMQWDLIYIWMFNTIVMILLQLRMINVSLLVSKSICTKSKRWGKEAASRTGNCPGMMGRQRKADMLTCPRMEQEPTAQCKLCSMLWQ